METLGRFLAPPRQSFFLFGPRGTGKTTWLRRTFPDALVLDLLQPDLARDLLARPERLRDLVGGSPPGATVVLDEVQRVPDVLAVVHALIEEPARRRFVLTGSSARKLRRGGVDLLGGRAVVRTLHPFMAAELPRFDLERALLHGLVPLVVASEHPDDVLRAYASVYLDQEVRLEGWVRHVGAFARFLEAISFSHGAVLNIAGVARECQVERKTAAGYVEVLEDLLLAFRVPVFTRRAKREPTSHPKLYLFDTGVYRALRPTGPLDRAAEIEGAALEGLVAQHLRAWIALAPGRNGLYFWRTRSGNEVDFVVYGSAGLWAVEVKNTARVRSEDLGGLTAFGADYAQATRLLLYRGARREQRQGVWLLPVDEFLRALRPDAPLWTPP